MQERLYAIRTNYGFLANFDGGDYRWTDDPDQVWAMSQFETTLHANRLDGLPGYAVKEWGFRRSPETDFSPARYAALAETE